MTESDPETILLRQAESELRQLHSLRDDTFAELEAALALAAPAGDHEGARVALQTAAAAISRAHYLSALVAALDNEIETKGFRVFDLHREAIAADQPRLAKIRDERAAARREALGTFSDPAKLPHPDRDISSYS